MKFLKISFSFPLAGPQQGSSSVEWAAGFQFDPSGVAPADYWLIDGDSNRSHDLPDFPGQSYDPAGVAKSNELVFQRIYDPAGVNTIRLVGCCRPVSISHSYFSNTHCVQTVDPRDHNSLSGLTRPPLESGYRRGARVAFANAYGIKS